MTTHTCGHPDQPRGQSARHHNSFFVTGFGSGAYSAKLFAGTRHQLSGFSHMRQCGEDVLRMLVTGGPPVRGGGGMPQRIITTSRSPPELRTTGAGSSGKTPGMGGRLPT
jgi:hypothetical protein